MQCRKFHAVGSVSQTIRMGHLKVTISSTEEDVTYVFSGEVDEDFQRTEIPKIAKKKTILDLAGISSFNSCGIREWVFWVQDLSRDSEIKFRACSVSMIDQINMIPQSLGRGQLESFYAPYYCEKCGEVNRLLHLRDCFSLIAQKKAPKLRCETCDRQLTFDTLESSYFLFMEHQDGATYRQNGSSEES